MSEHDGRLTLDGDHAVLTFVRHLPHPVEAVWAALTDPAQRAAWFGATTLDPRTGGLIETVPAGPPTPVPDKRITGRIRVWDPPYVLEHEWHQAIVEDSVVRYELSRDGEGTLLRFTHRGLGVRNARGFTPGTHAFLDRLQSHLAGAPLPHWGRRYAELAAQDPDGLPGWASDPTGDEGADGR